MSNAFPQRMIRIPLGGSEQILFDEDTLTNKNIRQFRLDISAAVAEYDDELKKMAQDFEALCDKYQESLKRKDKESDKAFETRTKEASEKFKEESKAVTPPEDNFWLHEVAFKILKVVARLGGQEQKVTREAFDGAPARIMKETIARLLVEHECPEGALFLPPKLKEEN